ncbi:MAG: NupC/NupG family nucleoside CNT transporter [Candidatus Dadabacteria bacterium]|nr:MAG: NupC/NupG family nucleoside CNT transporter [Candidatus Dadabacteria bacterium]
MHVLQAVLGMGTFIFLCWLFSYERSRIPWRVVTVGILLQFVFALLILKTAAARAFFGMVNGVFIKLYDFSGDGARFLAGDLVDSVPFLFHVLPVVIVYAAIMAVLYHLGIMHRIVYWIGLGMKKTLKSVSGAEALSAAANIFMGQTEAPLVVRPYIERMTRSELMVVMTGGMATVAGSVMAAYVGMLVDHFPNIAGHLMAASIMSAPAALVFAKILVPETGEPVTAGTVRLEHESKCDGPLHALADGAREGIALVANIAAMLIVFIALISAANFLWGALCHGFTALSGISTARIDTLQELLGYLFAPFAWLMGVPWQDLHTAGTLLGEKTVINEFVAYGDFAGYLKGTPLLEGGSVHQLSERTVIILTYALCGFSNFSSIGILIGGLGIFAPERKGEIARLGVRAMLAATLACFLTASIAATLI